MFGRDPRDEYFASISDLTTLFGSISCARGRSDLKVELAVLGSNRGKSSCEKSMGKWWC